MRHSTPALLVATALVLVAPALRAQGGPSAVVFSGPTMGTRYTVRVVASGLDDQGRDQIQTAIEAELDLADRLLSTWNPESEISRLNAHAVAEPFPLAPETVELLKLALQAGELSGGAFDVTVGPLVEAWGFGPEGPPARTPSAETREELRARVGQGLLALDPEAGTITKTRPDVAVDLSALAPGWTADRIANALAALGHRHLIVDIGGEVVTRGRRIDGTRWRVAVESPGGEPDKVLVLALENTAVATSGDYRNVYVDEAGTRRTHLIDPRTGEPVTHGLASVTVVHPEGVWADALATALLVMGPEPAWALAKRLNLPVRLVARSDDGSYTAATTAAFEALAWAGPGE